MGLLQASSGFVASGTGTAVTLPPATWMRDAAVRRCVSTVSLCVCNGLQRVGCVDERCECLCVLCVWLSDSFLSLRVLASVGVCVCLLVCVCCE